MAMTPLERKAAFKAAVTLAQTTLDAAASDVCGVTWFHLSEGLANRRALSAEVQAKFAAYIGRSVRTVFGPSAVAAA